MQSKFDIKHNKAIVKPENTDDLFILSQIIQPGAFVRARTIRSVEIKRDKERIKVGKRPVTLKIQIEKIELNQRLRLGGKIVEGPEDIEKGWHSILVEPMQQLTIEKEWKGWEIERIKKAQKKAEPVLVCILDEREADFYLIEQRAQHILHISCGSLGKEAGISRKPEYYGNILAELKRREERHIILAGPGFAREELHKQIPEKERVIAESCSHAGERGLQEILKRKVLDRLVKVSRIVEETKAVEMLLEEIAKEGKAVYGLEQTKAAIESGAVELLLISDKKVRELENLLELAEKMKGKIMIVSSEHEAGEKLFGLGGIAALLRYKIY